MPHKSAVEGFNKFILAFWLSDKGAIDNAAFWEKLTQSEQLEVIKGYKEVGITLMVSAFGATGKSPPRWYILRDLLTNDSDVSSQTNPSPLEKTLLPSPGRSPTG